MEDRQAFQQIISRNKQEEEVENTEIAAAGGRHGHIHAQSRVKAVEKSRFAVQHIVDMIIKRRDLLRHIIIIDGKTAKRENTLYAKDAQIDHKRDEHRNDIFFLLPCYFHYYSRSYFLLNSLLTGK